MLIHNTLPKKYINSINYINNYFKNYNLNGISSIHYWINDVDDEELRYHIDILRNAPEIKNTIKEHYSDCSVESSSNSDEIYLSVSPSNRTGSDITLSDCHYDAPFKYIYQGGCKFLRLILALNENNSVYTQVEEKTSLLTTGNYNIIDYNKDYHCVNGEIPPGKNRIMLKLHYICVPYNTNKNWVIFCRNINDWWTHVSRETMRESIKPTTLFGHIQKYIVLTFTFIYSYIHILFICFIILYVITNTTILKKFKKNSFFIYKVINMDLRKYNL